VKDVRKEEEWAMEEDEEGPPAGEDEVDLTVDANPTEEAAEVEAMIEEDRGTIGTAAETTETGDQYRSRKDKK
jgi:hypothetical protein